MVEIFQHNYRSAYQCYDMVSGDTGRNGTVVEEVWINLLRVGGGQGL